MTVAHFLYIPAIFGLGMLIGFVLRGRIDAIHRHDIKRGVDEREAARQARERAQKTDH